MNHAAINLNLTANRLEVLNDCWVLIADRGYDDSKLITRLFDGYDIRSIIDIRNFTKSDDGKTRKFEGYDNIAFEYQGTVYFLQPQAIKAPEMAYGGFEQKKRHFKKSLPGQTFREEICTREELSG